MKAELTTQDLVLAKAKIEDAEDIFVNFWSESQTAKYMLWKVCSNLEEAQERLQKAIEFQKNNHSWFVYYNGYAIGVAGVKEVAEGVFEDAGVGIGSKFVGKGFGKQIFQCLLRYVFVDLKAKEFITSADELNIASCSLQEKCGMKFTHKEELVRKRDDTKYTANYYKLTSEEYFKDKNLENA